MSYTTLSLFNLSLSIHLRDKMKQLIMKISAPFFLFLNELKLRRQHELSPLASSVRPVFSCLQVKTAVLSTPPRHPLIVFLVAPFVLFRAPLPVEFSFRVMTYPHCLMAEQNQLEIIINGWNDNIYRPLFPLNMQK